MRRLAVVMAVLCTACSGGTTQRAAQPAPTGSVAPVATTVAATTTTTLGYPVYEAAYAQVPDVEVYDAPGAAEPATSFANPDPYYDTVKVFLVKAESGDWLEVYLPARPNGSTGWIKRSDVNLTRHDFRLVVELGAHRLTAYEKDEVILQEPVAVGRSATPTTAGFFFTAERIKVHPLDQAAYGPWAFGLSAYSEVLYSFGGGDGQMGIHGTGDPSSVGRDVSNGCIRMTNDAITRLVEMLPEAGVPVEIRA